MGICVAAGVFDGVHRGHQRILTELRLAAERHHARAVAVTFDPHPRAVLRPEDAPPLLMPLAERIAWLKHYGAGEVRVLRFDAALAAMTPEAFLEMLTGEEQLLALAVGRDWHFGCRGTGNAAFLSDAGSRKGFEFIAVPEVEWHNRRIGSTEIRKLAAAGQLDEAAAMLGRAYTLYGKVGSGFQAAGRELRHPTANLELTAGVLPPDGVYAAKCLGHLAAVNIGIAPTYGSMNHNRRRVEVHLLDFEGNLYGRDLAVELHRFLRAERAFPGPEELRHQIGEDIRQIREIIHI